MTKSTDPQKLTEALRSVDPATPLTEEQHIRGDAMLERTLADTTCAPAPARRRTTRTFAKRVVTVVALASVVAIGSTIAVSSTGGDAFASYTPVPVPLTEPEKAAMAKKCEPKMRRWARSEEQMIPRHNRDLKQHAEKTGTEYSPMSPAFDPNDAIVALAERRGDVVVMAYAGKTQGFSIPCTAVMPVGSTKPKHVEMNGKTGGSDPRSVPPANTYVGGSMHIGPAPGTGGEFDLRPVQLYSLIQGPVGDNVVAMTVHTATAGDVAATIDNGRYTAWWPGDALEWPKDVPQVSGRDHSRLTYTISITLKDGTVIKDAESHTWS